MYIYNKKILVADPEISIRQLLKRRLSLLGYNVFLATNGKEALFLFHKEQPNLIILDAILPIINGYKVCIEIRKESHIPVIMLTALSNISDRIRGLELGADDYLIKPFSPKELEVRTYSILRRIHFQNSLTLENYRQNVLQVGSLLLDINKRQISKGKERIKLTDMEFNLLELLITKAGEQVSRSTIFDRIWGYRPERYLDTRIVDVHISRLRSKLEEDPSNPMIIITIRGIGYMFQK